MLVQPSGFPSKKLAVATKLGPKIFDTRLSPNTKMRPNELYASSIRALLRFGERRVTERREMNSTEEGKRMGSDRRQLQFFHFEKNLKDGPQSSTGPVRSINLRNEVCLQFVTVADQFLLLL
ncbi:hypothetical protein SLE2022_397820 [Rubroshorea leprosula]